jgi:hypothetical protein
MALCLGELKLEIMSPVSKEDHRARIVVVMNVDAVEANYFIIRKFTILIF